MDQPVSVLVQLKEMLSQPIQLLVIFGIILNWVDYSSIIMMDPSLSGLMCLHLMLVLLLQDYEV